MATDSQQAAPASEPQRLALTAAVMEIRQACDELGHEAHRSPFFFITGAGISYPPVPLAASVIEHCKSVAQRYKRIGTPSGSQTLDAYSHWFGCAYPGARQRQQYLRSLIEGKPLSLASLRLAHLLSARRLSNLVVTTNFDDFVARALRLFGTEPAVCDHPRTVGRIDRERDDVQIVHVHGSYLFYDCANLRGEVTGRARADEESSFTMVGLLDSLLWTRSPLVIGYSGWEGDVVMSALRRRLRGGNPLAQSVYWFCYRRAAIDDLPGWLRSSPDVRFVVPDEVPAAEATAQPAARGGAGQSATAARRATADPTAQPAPEATLPAFTVFDQLNRVFDVGTPALFENPIESFANSLQGALPGADGAAGDPYAFKALIERLHDAAREFASKRALRGIDADLDRLRTLMRESNYAQALPLLATIVPARYAKLAPAERTDVVAAAQLVARSLLDKPGYAQLAAETAQALVFDTRLQRSLGPSLPPGTSWVMASHSGQHAIETRTHGKTYGAFSYHFIDALRDAGADVDRDGRISLLEAAVACARRLLDMSAGHLPALAGDVGSTVLFEAERRPAAPRPAGRLHAVLVGMERFPWGNQLAGPSNDLARWSKLLGSLERSVHGAAQVHVLLNEQATLAQLGKQMLSVCKQAQPEDTVLFYYTGMGMRRDPPPGESGGQEIAVVLHDYDEKTGAGVLTHVQLLAAMSSTAAGRKIVILDF
ncbi:MAG: caspase family protein [Burkholderiales bacterium]|nr:caspase family protein [Burkholderiales bacterium]